MRRLQKCVLIVCAGTAAILSVLFVTPVREVRYDGKTLTRWLLVIDEGPISSHGDPNAYAEQDRAVEIVRMLGTNCVPVLLHLIQEHDSKAKVLLSELLSKQSLISFYRPSDQRLNTAGLRGFQILTTNAQCAIPALLQARITGNEQLRDCASVALKYVGYCDESPR
jgi:hypothetical protein